jgi:hypothetical protein
MSEKISTIGENGIIAKVWVEYLEGDDPTSAHRCSAHRAIQQALGDVLKRIEIRHGLITWSDLRTGYRCTYRSPKPLQDFIAALHKWWDGEGDLPEGFWLIVRESDELPALRKKISKTTPQKRRQRQKVKLDQTLKVTKTGSAQAKPQAKTTAPVQAPAQPQVAATPVAYPKSATGQKRRYVPPPPRRRAA